MSRPLPFLAATALLIAPPMLRARSGDLPQVMVVGVSHLEAKDDLHNSTWGSSVSSPGMQKQIGRIVDGLAKFRPTKVMIEARADHPVYVQRYQAYRRGRYRLGPNEDDQFGYRLAGLAGLPTIYPIDSTGTFPFDYDSVQAAAARDGQNSVLAEANAELTGLAQRMNRLQRSSNLIGLMRYLNTNEALKANAGWYLYLDLIGNGSSADAGQSLTRNWYARNLQIFANIARELRPGDRVVVFVGQGHAAMLRPMIDRAPFLADVDPESYLPAAADAHGIESAPNGAASIEARPRDQDQLMSRKSKRPLFAESDAIARAPAARAGIPFDEAEILQPRETNAIEAIADVARCSVATRRAHPIRIQTRYEYTLYSYPCRSGRERRSVGRAPPGRPAG